MQFSDLTTNMWLLLLGVALIQGMSKGGVPGMTILAIPLVSMVFPGKSATGLILPMLIVGDLCALLVWRKTVSVRDLLRALPWAVVGIVVGWRLLDIIDDTKMRPFIGGIVLFVLAIHVWRKYLAAKPKNAEPGADDSRLFKRVFAATMGLLGGVTTMLANAAGPVIGAYLLSMKLAKETFLGTSAWFFFIVNWIKVPFMVEQQMITLDSLKINAAMVPLLFVGVLLGILVVKHINQKTFDITVTALAALAGVRLLFS